MQFPDQSESLPMSQHFVDRRQQQDAEQPRSERRQFSDGHRSDRPEVDEFAKAIDAYKVKNRRRFITFEEIYDVITALGYHK